MKFMSFFFGGRSQNFTNHQHQFAMTLVPKKLRIPKVFRPKTCHTCPDAWAVGFEKRSKFAETSHEYVGL